MIHATPKEKFDKYQDQLWKEQEEASPPPENIPALLALNGAWRFEWRKVWYEIRPRWFSFLDAAEINVLLFHFRWCHRQLFGNEHDGAYFNDPQVQELLVQYKVSGVTLKLLFHKCCRPVAWWRRIRYRFHTPFRIAEDHEVVRLAYFFSLARMPWSGQLRLGLRASAPLQTTSLAKWPRLSLSTKDRHGLARMASLEAGDTSKSDSPPFIADRPS
jgi:hypothetical protein